MKRADELLESDPPRIRFSEINLHAVTGDRATFDRVHKRYFERLNTLYLAYLISEDEKYLPELTDTLWNILNFESWAYPVHIPANASLDKRRRFLAICSTRAGRDIAEIIYYIGDKLPELVVKRAKAELKYRIIDSYAEYDWPFETVKHNWASVCICGVLCVYLQFATEEEIEKQLPRMMKVADLYLEGYEDDCCCSEGVSYWYYGFSNFLIFATMLRDYTNGKINYFDNPKVKKIAMFQHRVRLNERDAVTFSDAMGIGYKVPRYLNHILKTNYPDYPLAENEPLTEAITESRNLFWTDPDFTSQEIKFSNDIFENVQWFMYYGKEYAVGAKAGHNNEFHNHNDVGSFMISKNDVISFFDAGPGKYTKQYFAPDIRYTIMNCSSLGHSVPIINGQAQKEGNRGICDIYALDREGHFAFEMKKAYIVDTLASLKREFNCNEDYFTLTDTYKFTETPTALVERFVSRLPITYENGVVKSGNSIIEFNADEFDVSVSELPAGGSVKVIYHVDFAPKTLNKVMTFTFKFI